MLVLKIIVSTNLEWDHFTRVVSFTSLSVIISTILDIFSVIELKFNVIITFSDLSNYIRLLTPIYCHWNNKTYRKRNHTLE